MLASILPLHCSVMHLANCCSQIFYVAWLAFEVVFVYFFIIETKNKSLEETSMSVLHPDIFEYRLNVSTTGFSMGKTPSANKAHYKKTK